MFDLDAARAEQHDATVVKRFRYSGKDWTVPFSPPILFADRLAKGEIAGALSVLFGEDNAAEILELGFEIDDLALVLRALYGIEPGE